MKNNRVFWLIRCTEHKHAVSFLESGQIRLSLPEVWIRDEIENSKGRGDYFEGVFAISSNVKFNQRLSIYKQRRNVSCETKQNLVYYRSLDCLKIPCFCLFFFE